MTSEVSQAISGLYEAFHRRGGAPVVSGCPCCTDEGEFDTLAVMPLRELSAIALERYARKAMTTVGHADTFRYFLPRIIELAVAGAFQVEREIIFGKLRYGGWAEWPDAERNAIQVFSRAVSATFSLREYDSAELDEWVCALGQFTTDFGTLLQPLLSETAEARSNLAALVRYNTEGLAAGELANAFWADDNSNRQLFVDWLLEQRVQPAAG
jgi:hypothetical protein